MWNNNQDMREDFEHLLKIMSYEDDIWEKQMQHVNTSLNYLKRTLLETHMKHYPQYYINKSPCSKCKGSGYNNED